MQKNNGSMDFVLSLRLHYILGQRKCNVKKAQYRVEAGNFSS